MATSIAASGQNLFVADEKGVKAFDVSNVDHPVREAEYLLAGSMKRIRVSGDFVFVCAGRDFIIFEIKHLPNK